MLFLLIYIKNVIYRNIRKKYKKIYKKSNLYIYIYI